MALVPVPAGASSPVTEGAPDEQTQRVITLERWFYLGRFEGDQ